jgi:hypothetical protein
VTLSSAWCDWRMPRREGEVFRFGTAMIQILRTDYFIVSYCLLADSPALFQTVAQYSDEFSEIKRDFDP